MSARTILLLSLLVPLAWFLAACGFAVVRGMWRGWRDRSPAGCREDTR